LVGDHRQRELGTAQNFAVAGATGRDHLRGAHRRARREVAPNKPSTPWHRLQTIVEHRVLGDAVRAGDAQLGAGDLRHAIATFFVVHRGDKAEALADLLIETGLVRHQARLAGAFDEHETGGSRIGLHRQGPVTRHHRLEAVAHRGETLAFQREIGAIEFLGHVAHRFGARAHRVAQAEIPIRLGAREAEQAQVFALHGQRRLPAVTAIRQLLQLHRQQGRLRMHGGAGRFDRSHVGEFGRRTGELLGRQLSGRNRRERDCRSSERQQETGTTLDHETLPDLVCAHAGTRVRCVDRCAPDRVPRCLSP
jgi:hypothetical protein